MKSKYKQQGSLLAGVIMISAMISLLTIVLTYVVNEKFNASQMIKSNDIIRKITYRNYMTLEAKLSKNPINYYIEGEKKHYINKQFVEDYQLMPSHVLKDNLDNFYGSLYYVFDLKSLTYAKGDSHQALSYDGYYWEILSFYALTKDLLSVVIMPPVIDFSKLDELQKSAYEQTFEKLKQFGRLQILINDNKLVLKSSNKFKSIINQWPIGFSCHLESCHIQSGWRYQNNQYIYVIIVKGIKHLKVWALPVGALLDLGHYQTLAVNLNLEKEGDLYQGEFLDVFLLFNISKTSYILTQVKLKNDQTIWAYLSLDMIKEDKHLIKTKKDVPISQVFSISKKLNLNTSGFLALNEDKTLSYYDDQLEKHQVLNLRYKNKLVDLSVVDNQSNGYLLFLFFTNEFLVYQVDLAFDHLKQAWKKAVPNVIKSASVRYGLVWLLNDYELTVYQVGENKPLIHQRVNMPCYFEAFANISFYCGNTQIKINDIVHPYHRQAFRETNK
ncbi:hypothetical protein L3V79_02185 [Thiotrichales bacterium 19S9-12]|nr:hypothetical protein [Thiotrichales bacterium 19S9-11]MCF6811167.1 hypothetical protein [Thiotrichales bacterium 19S9-12]